MKKFKLSEVAWDNSCNGDAKWIHGDLYFPRGDMDWEIYRITVYKEGDNPYECELVSDRDEYPNQRIEGRKCATDEEVEAFVNECFDYVRDMHGSYLVGNVSFIDLKRAKDYAKGREIKEIYGPYSNKKELEFFEGEGEFLNQFNIYDKE